MSKSPSPAQHWVIRIQQTATFLFLLYVLYLLGRSAWLNAQSNQKVTELRIKIAQLESENNRLRYLIVYQQTDSFRELEARQKLGLKKPGELVIALPAEPAPAEIAQANESTIVATDPLFNLSAWWNYFFG